MRLLRSLVAIDLTLLAAQRHFERPQLIYLNTEMVVKQCLKYFDGSSKVSFYCFLERPLEKFERPFWTLKIPLKSTGFRYQ